MKDIFLISLLALSLVSSAPLSKPGVKELSKRRETTNEILELEDQLKKSAGENKKFVLKPTIGSLPPIDGLSINSGEEPSNDQPNAIPVDTSGGNGAVQEDDNTQQHIQEVHMDSSETKQAEIPEQTNSESDKSAGEEQAVPSRDDNAHVYDIAGEDELQANRMSPYDLYRSNPAGQPDIDVQDKAGDQIESEIPGNGYGYNPRYVYGDDGLNNEYQDMSLAERQEAILRALSTVPRMGLRENYQIYQGDASAREVAKKRGYARPIDYPNPEADKPIDRELGQEAMPSIGSGDEQELFNYEENYPTNDFGNYISSKHEPFPNDLEALRRYMIGTPKRLKRNNQDAARDMYM